METLTTTAPVTPETVTPLRPSEALRLGSLTVEQGFGYLIDYRIERVGWDETKGEVRSACAMGTMALACGENIARIATASTWWHPSWRDPVVDELPCGRHRGGKNTTASVAVAHLNDEHRWSRSEIATWLEGLGL